VVVTVVCSWVHPASSKLLYSPMSLYPTSSLPSVIYKVSKKATLMTQQLKILGARKTCIKVILVQGCIHFCVCLSHPPNHKPLTGMNGNLLISFSPTWHLKGAQQIYWLWTWRVRTRNYLVLPPDDGCRRLNTEKLGSAAYIMFWFIPSMFSKYSRSLYYALGPRQTRAF